MKQMYWLIENVFKSVIYICLKYDDLTSNATRKLKNKTQLNLNKNTGF